LTRLPQNSENGSRRQRGAGYGIDIGQGVLPEERPAAQTVPPAFERLKVGGSLVGPDDAQALDHAVLVGEHGQHDRAGVAHDTRRQLIRAEAVSSHGLGGVLLHKVDQALAIGQRLGPTDELRIGRQASNGAVQKPVDAVSARAPHRHGCKQEKRRQAREEVACGPDQSLKTLAAVTRRPPTRARDQRRQVGRQKKRQNNQRSLPPQERKQDKPGHQAAERAAQVVAKVHGGAGRPVGDPGLLKPHCRHRDVGSAQQSGGQE